MADHAPQMEEKKRSRHYRPKHMKGRVYLIVGIACFVIAAAIMGFLIFRYVSADIQHKTVVQVAGMNTVGTQRIGDVVPPDADIDDLTVNWDALREINTDIVGWVMIPDTRINYPIVQTSDNRYYLNHLFDKTYSDAGAIFLDYAGPSDIRGRNNFVYGHNLLDGSMFACLKQYQGKEFFDAHKTIFLATPKMSCELEVIACLVCDDDERICQFQFRDLNEYHSYVNMLMDYAVYDEFPTGKIPDNIYCFVTCTDTNYSKRTLVMARIVKEKVPGKVSTP